jgi:hypothetical protein
VHRPGYPGAVAGEAVEFLNVRVVAPKLCRGTEGNPFATITINGGRVRKNTPNDIKYEPNCVF